MSIEIEPKELNLNEEKKEIEIDDTSNNNLNIETNNIQNLELNNEINENNDKNDNLNNENINKEGNENENGNKDVNKDVNNNLNNDLNNNNNEEKNEQNKEINNNSKLKKNLLWIEKNIENGENKEKIKEFEILKIYNIFIFEDLEKMKEKLLSYKFMETIIILTEEFIDKFYKTISTIIPNLYIIPKVYIYTNTKTKYEINLEYKDSPFYDINFIFDNFSLLKQEIEKDEILEYFSKYSNFYFEKIENENQLILPLYYYKLITLKQQKIEDIIEFNKFLQNQFKSKNKIINDLLSLTFFYNTPIELLIKYWLRLYTYSDFSKLINENLKNKTENKYGIFTQVLYEGLEINNIQPVLNKKLYRGGIIIKDELNKIINSDKQNINIPNFICFIKNFVTFTLDENIVLEYLNNNKNNINDYKELVLFEIDEGNDIFDKENATNTDISNFSFYPEKKEILFFPFSCFEISEVYKIGESKYDFVYIKMNYLGKYKSKVPKEIKNWNNIPESNFVSSFFSSSIYVDEEIRKIVDNNKNVFDFNIKKYLISKIYKIKKNIDNQDSLNINQEKSNEKSVIENSKIFKYKWELRY